jgi:hypothetical protein
LNITAETITKAPTTPANALDIDGRTMNTAARSAKRDVGAIKFARHRWGIAFSVSNMRGSSNRLIGIGRHWLMAAPTAEHRYISGGHWRTPDSIESQ